MQLNLSKSLDSIFQNSNQVHEEHLLSLFQTAFTNTSSIERCQTEIALAPFPVLPPHQLPFLQQLYGAIGVLLYELNRCDPSKSSGLLKEYLRGLRYSQQLIEQISDGFEKTRTDSREVLQATGFDLDQLVDLNWRLDYVLQSSEEGMIKTPRYLVEFLLLSSSGDYHRKRLTCSVEELQDMLDTVKEARKAIEHLVKQRET